MKLSRAVLLVALGLAGFVVILAVRDSGWRSEHEKLARQLCNSIPIGMSAQTAKERARELAKVVAGIEVKELSIRAEFPNPNSPGDRIYCEANIWNDKIVNNEVRVD